jgi:hypothetical protein
MKVKGKHPRERLGSRRKYVTQKEERKDMRIN